MKVQRREPSLLETAMATHKRVSEYPREGLSANELTILILGDEVRRLVSIIRRHRVACQEMQTGT